MSVLASFINQDVQPYERYLVCREIPCDCEEEIEDTILREEELNEEVGWLERIADQFELQGHFSPAAEPGEEVPPERQIKLTVSIEGLPVTITHFPKGCEVTEDLTCFKQHRFINSRMTVCVVPLR